MRSIIDIQIRLADLGYDPGPADGVAGPRTLAAVKEFQSDNGLKADGIVGPLTEKALYSGLAVMNAPEESGLVPASWMPAAKMKGIVIHWTAGQHKASSLDKEHYHVLIEDDGKLVRGIPTIDLNSLPKAKKGYAAHALNCNTGFIGVSMCGMAGAKESPFDAGKQPLTAQQWDTMTSVVAELAKHYGIPVTDKTVLTHAEIEPNLGIKQKGKWDITRLAFDNKVVGAKACGDKLRAEVKAKL